MKPGDLVKRIDHDSDSFTRFLSGGDKKCWDKFGRLIHSNVALEFNDVGIVLLTKKLVLRRNNLKYYLTKTTTGRNKKAYVKILTSRGTGWIFESYIGVVQSSVGG